VAGQFQRAVVKWLINDYEVTITVDAAGGHQCPMSWLDYSPGLYGDGSWESRLEALSDGVTAIIMEHLLEQAPVCKLPTKKVAR
jgi:hypothetical protein